MRARRAPPISTVIRAIVDAGLCPRITFRDGEHVIEGVPAEEMTPNPAPDSLEDARKIMGAFQVVQHNEG